MAALPKEYWIWPELEESPVERPAIYEHYEPLPGPDWIRVLVLEPSMHLEDPLECDLQTVPLQPHSNYVALSYSWGRNSDGDKSLSRTIYVAGKPMLITQNLFEGLRRIRPWGAPRRIWIDGLCINQADDVERSAQVAVMARIYNYSTETALWLGEGDSEAKDIVIMRLLEQLETCHESDLKTIFKAFLHKSTCLWLVHRMSCTCICSDPLVEQSLEFVNSRGEIVGFPEAVGAILKHVRPDILDLIEEGTKSAQAFLQRRYWNRRWIVQELFHSGPKQMYWGPCRFDLSQRDFAVSLDKIHSLMKNLSWTLRGGVSNETDESCKYEQLARDAEAIRELFRPSYPDSTSLLVHALGRFKLMECQDSRDRLYAFISLDESFNIVPAYHLTTEEVYLQFAQALIDRGMFMDILHNFRQRFVIEDEQALNLPSWVPDLRMPFVASPKRTYRIPQELWAHRDGSLTCSLYYLATVESIDYGSDQVVSILLVQDIVRPGTKNAPPMLIYSVQKWFQLPLEDLYGSKPAPSGVQSGDFLFSPTSSMIPADTWDPTRLLFLRNAGPESSAMKIVGGFSASSLTSEELSRASRDKFESTEEVVRIV